MDGRVDQGGAVEVGPGRIPALGRSNVTGAGCPRLPPRLPLSLPRPDARDTAVLRLARNTAVCSRPRTKHYCRDLPRRGPLVRFPRRGRTTAVRGPRLPTVTRPRPRVASACPQSYAGQGGPHEAPRTECRQGSDHPSSALPPSVATPLGRRGRERLPPSSRVSSGPVADGPALTTRSPLTRNRHVSPAPDAYSVQNPEIHSMSAFLRRVPTLPSPPSRDLSVRSQCVRVLPGAVTWPNVPDPPSCSRGQPSETEPLYILPRPDPHTLEPLRLQARQLYFLRSTSARATE